MNSNISAKAHIGNSVALACPICGIRVQSVDHDFWNCPADPAHYWLWRGERNNGAVRKFLTQPHPAKQGPFYEQTLAEHEAFLEQAKRRMHAGDYTPFGADGKDHPVPAVQLPSAVDLVADTCHLCAAHMPPNGSPLCASCEEDEAAKWDDYRAEQQQARRPF